MTSSTAKAVVAVALALGQPAAALAQDGFDPRLQPTVQQLLAEGDRNFVLNHLRLGVQALEIGQREVAARSFDEALAGITAIYAGSESAARARSLWIEEGSKDFRGEPYERAMAFYYRGLLDLMNGEYDTARASFRAGQLQDAFAEEEQNRADFAMLLYLDGWSSHLLGDADLAQQAFAEARLLRPDLPLPADGDNVLVIAESGPSPRKLADGIGHAKLVYRRGKRFTEQRAALVTPDGAETLYPLEDIFWQAATRGGRPVDAILEGQVKFRNTAAGFGSVLTDVSSSVTESNNWYSGGGSSGTANVVGAVGIVALALAARSKPQADTRYWDNLPDAVHVTTRELARGAEPGWGMQYLDRAGNPVAGLETPAAVHWDKRGNGVVWTRSRYSIEP